MKFIEFTFQDYMSSKPDTEVIMMNPNEAEDFMDHMNSMPWSGHFISYKILTSKEAREFVDETIKGLNNMAKLSLIKKYIKCYGQN